MTVDNLPIVTDVERYLSDSLMATTVSAAVAIATMDVFLARSTDRTMFSKDELVNLILDVRSSLHS